MAGDWVDREWGGYLLCTSSFLLSFTNPMMKVSRTVWTLTPSHFPALRHHSRQFTNLFYYYCYYFLRWAHKLCCSFFWGFSVTVQCLCCSPPLFVSLTHSCSHCLLNVVVVVVAVGQTLLWFIHTPVFIWISALVWMHVWAVYHLGDLHVCFE